MANADWARTPRSPATPRKLSAYDTPGFTLALLPQEDVVWAADQYQGVSVFRLSASATPTQIGRYQTSGSAVGIAFSGTHALLADGDAGLQIIDVGRAGNPVTVGKFETNRFFDSLALLGNYACVADREKNLRIIDVSDLTHPHQVSFLELLEPASSIAILSNRYALLAQGSAGLRVVDLNAPSNPKHAGQVDTAGFASGVAVHGQYALVAYGSAGLLIIDLSDPAAPQAIGAISTSGYFAGIAVEDEYAYIADEREGLKIVSFQNPASPQEVGSFPVDGLVNAVTVRSNLVFLAKGNTILIFDVAQRENPKFLQELPNISAASLVVRGNELYAAAGADGLSIWQFSTPTLSFTGTSFSQQGAFRTSLAGTPGLVVRIQRSENLQTWTDWQTKTLTDSPAEISDLVGSASGRFFYRAVSP